MPDLACGTWLPRLLDDREAGLWLGVRLALRDYSISCVRPFLQGDLVVLSASVASSRTIWV
jgi:hypothetical protein